MCVYGVITLNTTGKKKRGKKIVCSRKRQSKKPRTNTQWVYLDGCTCASFCVYRVCVYLWVPAVVSAVLH